jgi:hypothetical protein
MGNRDDRTLEGFSPSWSASADARSRLSVGSPYQSSRSNGYVSPSIASRSQMTARLPVRPPDNRILISCSGGGGGPASSNFRSLVTAAWYREAMPEL